MIKRNDSLQLKAGDFMRMVLLSSCLYTLYTVNFFLISECFQVHKRASANNVAAITPPVTALLTAVEGSGPISLISRIP